MFELRSYTFEQGPPVPTGKRNGDVGAFIRKLQLAELHKGGKGIFAPVPLKYVYRWKPSGDYLGGPRRKPVGTAAMPQHAPEAYRAAIIDKHCGNYPLVREILARQHVEGVGGSE